MAKRKMTEAQFRELAKARLTKGAAFMMHGEEYQDHLIKTQVQLECMTLEEIQKQWPYLMADIRIIKGR